MTEPDSVEATPAEIEAEVMGAMADVLGRYGSMITKAVVLTEIVEPDGERVAFRDAFRDEE